jgi:hypothetical protein
MDLLYLHEAASIVRQSERSLRRAIARGDLAAKHTSEGGRLLIERGDLDNYLKAVKPRPEAGK